MESDTKPVDRKRVEGFDGSGDEPSEGGESNQGFDGPRVLDKKEMNCGSVDGNLVGGDDGDINSNTPLKELSMRKNLRDRKAGGKDDSFDGSGAENGIENLMGSDSLTQKPEYGVNGNDDNTPKAMGDCGGEGENLKSRVKRGRKPKVASSDKVTSDQKFDSDEKVAEVLGSISQRTRNRVVKGKKEEVKDMDVEQNASESNDGNGHETGFSIGDFVWGKIKSHPWWPGRINDPLAASDLAMRYKHEGRLLVAYFGDGTFAWCDPSQLKPFERNFEDMSKQSSLKNFVNAVEEALSEFCSLIELKVTCSCAKKGIQSSLPLVMNAGIKEGVHVPLNGVEKSSAVHFEPAKVLAEIRNFARNVSVTNMLEARLLKSHLSAFYHFQRGFSLPAYHEPMGIEEIVDEDSVLTDNLARGPHENWHANAGELSVAQTGPETPDGKLRKTRKVKSMAELLGTDAKAELKEDKQSGKAASKSGKKKRKVINEDQTDGHESNDDKTRSTKDEGQSGKPESKSGRKKKKSTDENQSDVVENFVKTRSSTRKKEENTRATAAGKKPSNDQRKSEKLPKERKIDRKLSVDVGPGNGFIAEELQQRISPREKKSSKYLSPPYTSPLQVQKLLGSGSGHLDFSDVARMGERMSKAAGKLAGSPPIVKCSAETFQKSSKGSSSASERTLSPDNQTHKLDMTPKVDVSIKSVGSPNEVLCEMRSAALDPLKPRKGQSFDTIKGFLSSYRNASYKNGSDYNLYKKQLADQKKRKRNSSNVKQGSDKKGSSHIDPDSSEPKTPRRNAKKVKETKLTSKVEHELENGSISSATLLITFPKDFTLPTKEDLMKMHSKFGNLDESKTEVIPKSSSAKIVFFERSEAEAAMNSMQKSSPFGTAKVSYKICHLRASTSEAKKVDTKKRKRSKSSQTQEDKSSDKTSPVAPENEPLAVIFIKQKLEAMNSMLAQTDGKMSEETKSNLESEVKELLKKVKMMTGSSSSSSASPP